MPDHIQIDDTTPRIAYTATAAQTAFTVPFAFFEDEDLVVYVDDVLQTLGEDEDYTATGSGASAAETRKVIFNSGLVGGESVVIVRTIVIERTTDFPTSGRFLINALNTQLDKLFAIAQQLADSIARTLRLADSDTTENLDIPAASERANKFLGFDANGDPMMSTAVDGTPVSVFMATVLDDATAAEARSTLGIESTALLTNYAGISNWHHCR